MVRPCPLCSQFISFYSLQMYSIQHTWWWNTQDSHLTPKVWVLDESNHFWEPIHLWWQSTTNQFIIKTNIVWGTPKAPTTAWNLGNTSGTKLRLMGAAILFQVPVYCCYTSLCRSKYHWEATNPIASSGNLRTPEVVKVKEDPAFYMQTPHHFQLIYWESTHFDSLHCFATS